MEKATQLVLELMDKGVITPRQASALIRYAGLGEFTDEKLSIIERLATRGITFEEATELLSGIVGGENPAEKEEEARAYWKRRHVIRTAFRMVMILVLVVVILELKGLFKETAEALATTEGLAEWARILVTGVQVFLAVLVAPMLAVLWLEGMFTVICVPYTLLKTVFSSRKSREKLAWTATHLIGGAVAIGSFFMMFYVEPNHMLVQVMWLFLCLLSLGIPPLAFFWIGHPDRPKGRMRAPDREGTVPTVPQ